MSSCLTSDFRPLISMTSKPAKTTSKTHDENLHGWSVDSSDPALLHNAIELAFNYRGDITVARKSTGDLIEGYLFDRRADKISGETVLRIIPKDSEARITIPASDIASLRFTGKDTASGKSFESWIKKYIQKKLAGESANIESDPLEESV